MKLPRVVDLFCGAGGLSLGLRDAGFLPVFAADLDKHACETYRQNLGSHVHCLDLGKIDASELCRLIKKNSGPVDIVAGGPPCQGFSVQGPGNTNDPRNKLVLNFAHISAALKPQAIIMENVPTILGERGQKYISKVRQIWENAGFDVYSEILEAAAYGVPQMRRRAFLVALRKDLGCSFQFPLPKLKPSNYVTVRKAIGSLPPPTDDFSEHPLLPNHVRVAISKPNLERLSYVPEGGGRLDIPLRLQLPCHRNSNGHRHLDVFGRLWWDKPSGTITAMFDNFTRGRFAHPEQNRNITSREGARLQAFPDDFVFSGPKKDVARQIGNAVSPLLAREVGYAVLKSLRKSFVVQKKLQRAVS